MINVFDTTELEKIQSNLIELFKKESRKDKNIMNVHSINPQKLKNDDFNVVFDYGAVVVHISINDSIMIKSSDKVKDIVKSMILKWYPDYKKFIK